PRLLPSAEPAGRAVPRPQRPRHVAQAGHQGRGGRGMDGLIRAGERKGDAMTEQEWLACGDPRPMVTSPLGQKSDRKLRLFSCACARKSWAALGGWQEVLV